MRQVNKTSEVRCPRCWGRGELYSCNNWIDCDCTGGKIKSNKAAEVMVQVLLDTENCGVCTGDSGLLHELCSALGRKHEGYLTEKKMLDAIDRTHKGVLVKAYTNMGGGRKGRVFYLPDWVATNRPELTKG